MTRDVPVTRDVPMARDVVLGLGSCLDYEITWDGAVVQRLVDEYAVTPAEIGRDVVVESERDLVRSVLGFVRDGVGGERFVASSDIVETFAARFPRRITLGGSNVRAAVAMSRLGLRSVLHTVSVDDNVRRLLPAGVTYLCSAEHDSTDPHLIVQFPAGASVRVGDVVLDAPHPNRLIYVNDLPNREMVLSPGLGDLLANAGIFLVSGFNTVQDAATLDARMAFLRAQMRRLPDDATVVFEDAGYHVPALSARVREALLDRIDVYGLNEDEMQAYVGRPVDLLAPGPLAHALQDLRRAVPARLLVVHTKYWALAHGPGADGYREALEAATAMAGVRYLEGDGFTAEQFRAMPAHPRHAGGEALAAALALRLPGEVCVVPAYALSTPAPTTVGLGDAFVGGFVAGLVGERVGEREGSAQGSAQRVE